MSALLIPRLLKDIKQRSRRNKKKKEVEMSSKTVTLYEDYSLTVQSELDYSGEGWQDLFGILASFCSKHKLVADVGCGRYELLVIKNSEDSVGVDISRSSLRALLNDGFLGHVVQCDCKLLPFKDGCFDCLISNQVIEHMTSKKNLNKLLNEMIRISSNLMIVTPNSAFRKRIHDVTHFYFFTVRDLNKLLPDFKIFASSLPPENVLRYYFLYHSSSLRSVPLLGPLIYQTFLRLDSSRLMSWINKRLWVGDHLVAVKTKNK